MIDRLWYSLSLLHSDALVVGNNPTETHRLLLTTDQPTPGRIAMTIFTATQVSGLTEHHYLSAHHIRLYFYSRKYLRKRKKNRISVRNYSNEKSWLNGQLWNRNAQLLIFIFALDCPFSSSILVDHDFWTHKFRIYTLPFPAKSITKWNVLLASSKYEYF